MSDLKLAMRSSQLLWDARADAEREVLKLRKLLVKQLCDCRRLSLDLPVEPNRHRLTCLYRREMGAAMAEEAQRQTLDWALKKLFPNK